MCARNASRDAFDARELLQHKHIVLETARLRLAFVVYGGINRKDWRNVRIEAATSKTSSSCIVTAVVTAPPHYLGRASYFVDAPKTVMMIPFRFVYLPK